MNRMLYLVFVLFAVQATASAQTPPVYKMAAPVPGAEPKIQLGSDYKHVGVRAAGVPARSIIHALGEAIGYQVWGEAPSDPLSVTIPNEEVDVALTMILTPIGYRYEKNDVAKTITIYEQGQIWEHASPTKPPILPPPSNLTVQATPQIRYSYSAAVLPDNYNGGPTWMDYRMEEARVAEEATRAYNLAVHQQRMAEAANAYVVPPTLYGGVYPYYPAVGFTEGSMKTTGDVKGVALYVEGCYIGDANQFNSWWDQKSALLSGKALRITARRGNRAFTRTVIAPSVATNWLTNARHLPFGIHNEDFDGPESTTFNAAAMDQNCRSSPMATAIQ